MMEDKKISRRTLLGTAGAAGALLVAGGLLLHNNVHAAGEVQLIAVDDIAALKALAQPEEGQIVLTRGYYAANDGGGAWYRIVASTSYTGTPDGYVDHTVGATGKVAVMDLSNGIDMLQAGVQSGVDCTARVRAAYAKNARLYTYTGDMAPIIDCDDPNYPTTRNNGGIRPPNHSEHVFDGRFRFQAKTSSLDRYTLFNLQACERVTMRRPWVIGDIETHQGTTGEWGYGFYMAGGAQHVTLVEGKAEKFWGDGYFIGVAEDKNTMQTAPEHITLENCIADSNRRQGLSITAVKHGRIIGGEYRNTGKIASTPPSYGIDIEPDNHASAYIDVALTDVVTRGNSRGGIQFVPGYLSAANVVNPFYNVYVSNYHSVEDGNVGAMRFAYPDLSSSININRKLFGSIVIEKATIERPVTKGVDWSRWIRNAPEVIASDVTVLDPNTAGIAAPTNHARCAFSLEIVADNVSKGMQTIGIVTLIRPRAIDTRATPKMMAPFWIQTAPGSSIQRLRVLDPASENDLDGNKGFLRINAADGVTVGYVGDRPVQLLDQPLTITDGMWAGYELRLPAAASGIVEVQLPPAAVSLGLTYTIVNASQAGGQVRIKANGADQLKRNGAAGSAAQIVDAQEAYTVKAHMPGLWLLLDQI
ncbi:twin-arginine translocation signal domain-containing protein [Paenibacillus ginsengarvi]|uniref:Twin-arginine translocation signal domain-containing protein n=1 Tax=Paenibacillus ginsengarvi TaxID=400777 RepID=A0A3B0BTY6_9BACL|nr:twin-arginine translocation signal domain-containing protein [Paenibacillus ginsengarvi]RKN75848.1 twin-arginine translocation signal domain-containing protein [Paenibacillus ginsengarvi]